MSYVPKLQVGSQTDEFLVKVGDQYFEHCHEGTADKGGQRETVCFHLLDVCFSTGFEDYGLVCRYML